MRENKSNTLFIQILNHLISYLRSAYKAFQVCNIVKKLVGAAPLGLKCGTHIFIQAKSYATVIFVKHDLKESVEAYGSGVRTHLRPTVNSREKARTTKIFNIFDETFLSCRFLITSKYAFCSALNALS